MLPIFKTKKFIFFSLTVLLIIGFFGFSKYRQAQQPPDYELATVERGQLRQTVEATGKIESVNDLSLRFETAGTLDTVNVKEGDSVKAGQILASLRLSELNASVAQASANLNQKLAGATKEEISYYQAAVDVAKSAWDKAIIDAGNAIATAESTLETARNNLKLAEGGDSSQIVSQVYENAVALLFASLSVLDNSLSQADNILGVDNALANDDFENLLAITNPYKLDSAKITYNNAKLEKEKAKNKILPINLTSERSAIDEALLSAEAASEKMNQLLVGVAEVLNATLPGTGLTQASLETKKSTIESTRTSLSAHYTSLISQKQAIVNAQNSYSTYQIAYNKALRDWEDAKALSDTNIASKKASYDQAVANLQQKTTAPRNVDVAYYRATLAQAIAMRDRAILKAPIDGIVTKLVKKKGEFISSSDVIIQLLSPHYEIEVDIPETDVSKLKINDEAIITLDAFGEEVKFSGKILKIEPSSTEVQDVVYYRIRVTLDETEMDIKPGMTANVNITTAFLDDVLYIPLRSVRTDVDGKYVRILSNGQEIRRAVVTGLRGDNGLVEVISGLNEGEKIILSIRTAD